MHAGIGGADPAASGVSLNLKRCHLNESQRAMVTAKLAKTAGKQCSLARDHPKTASHYLPCVLLSVLPVSCVLHAFGAERSSNARR